MIKTMIKRMRSDEEGAVLIAGLAAAMMLFIIALTAYDAGGVVRDRVLIQTAADSAAYSHASVRARTMNANAFANVTKRSILGVFFTFYAAANAYNQDISAALDKATNGGSLDPGSGAPEARLLSGGKAFSRASESFNNPASFPYNNRRNQTQHLSLEGNMRMNMLTTGVGMQVPRQQQRLPHTSYPVVGGPSESLGSTRNVRFLAIYVTAEDDHAADGTMVRRMVTTGDVSSPVRPSPIRKYAQELRQITRYQAFLQGITPWWAFAEMSRRAASNGASVAVSWPPPPGASGSSSLTSAAGASAPTSVIDWRTPGSGSGVGLASNVRSSALSAGSESDVLNACLPFARKNGQRGASSTAGLNVAGVMRGGDGWKQEMMYNVSTLAARSKAVGHSSWAGGVLDPDFGLSVVGQASDRAPHLPGKGTVGGYSLCILALSGAGYTNRIPSGFGVATPARSPIDPEYAAPFLVQTKGVSPEMMDLRRSIFVFAGREPREWGGGGERLDVAAGDYSSGALHNDAKLESLYTMARSEIVALDVEGTNEGMTGGDATGDWHANWGARMRPIFVDDEAAVLRSELGASSGAGLLQAALAQSASMANTSAALSGQGSAPANFARDLSSVGRALGVHDEGVSAGVVK